MLEVFDNDSFCFNLCVSHSCAIHGTASPPLLVHRRLRWFGYFVGCPEDELIKDFLLPTPPGMWRRRAGGQLKTWATTIKADLEPISGPRVFGHARWRKDWVNASSTLARDRRAWSASVRDVVNAIGDAVAVACKLPLDLTGVLACQLRLDLACVPAS